MDVYKKRRTIIIVLLTVLFSFIIVTNSPNQVETATPTKIEKTQNISDSAKSVLNKLVIKNRTSNDDYIREKFGSGWVNNKGCDTRNIILNRDLIDAKIDDKCNVISGILNDPYTGKIINFTRGTNTSDDIQIDHVVALSNAWQTGAERLSNQQRIDLANDPLELLAVDGSANQQKSDGDASVWLPLNKSFRCQYIARQIAVKQKYSLWVTSDEFNTMTNILDKCPNQLLPSP